MRPDPDRLAYGLRTAGAAALAVWLAWALGLEHPQWAGMTVWAASPPVRSHLIEKSGFRALGTVVGAIFGVMLAVAAARAGGPALLVAGVAVWLGLCAFAGNLLRGFASYGALLAGYTAVMVALLDSGHPEDVVGLGLDRTATVLIGVGVALAVGLVLTPRGVEAEIPRRLRLAGASILRGIAAELQRPGSADADGLIRTLGRLAEIDDEIDLDGAGSLAARREARQRRKAVLSQVAALLWLHLPRTSPRTGPVAAPALAAEIDAIAEAYEAHAPASSRRRGLARAARRSAPDLRRVLSGLGAALPRHEPDDAADDVADAAGPEPLVLHRDFVAAREAGVRAGATMLAIGAVWVATGWAGGPMVMLGTAIMTSVFSTVANPFAVLPKVAVGQAMGAAAALACRWLIWPHLDSEPALLATMLPFILLGGLLISVPRLQIQAFDYNMVLLLLLQPALPLVGSFGHALGVALAVAAAPPVAWLAFRLIHPPSAGRRRAALAAAMVREVETMAARPDARRRARVWRARLHHRLLRLVRWSELAGGGADEALAGGLAVLLAGRAVLALEGGLAEPGQGASARRRLRLARARLAGLGQAPLRAADALAAASRAGARDADLLAAAADAIRRNAGFLASAGAR